MPLLSNILARFKPQVAPHEKEELAAMQEETSRQRDEATILLHEARTTGARLAASRQRNHYRLLLDEILGGNPS
jgi:hypothetical protein